MTTRIIVILTGLLFSVTGLSAADILIINPSFETLPVGGLPMSCGTGCTFSTTPIPGWTSTGTGSGQLDPALPPVTPAQFSFVPDGTVVAYSNGGTISQTVGDTVLAGVPYIFTVDLGLRADVPGFQSSANLVLTPLSGPPIVIPTTGATPAPGGWSIFTATFTGSLATAGDSITIQLVSGGIQGNFDNVHLTAIPEPGSAALLGLVGLPAIAYFRRRRTAR